jgi:hypothetical protein
MQEETAIASEVFPRLSAVVGPAGLDRNFKDKMPD